jgi:hypothetical protein
MEVAGSVIDYTVRMCTVQGNNAIRIRKAKRQANAVRAVRVAATAARPISAVGAGLPSLRARMQSLLLPPAHWPGKALSTPLQHMLAATSSQFSTGAAEKAEEKRAVGRRVTAPSVACHGGGRPCRGRRSVPAASGGSATHYYSGSSGARVPDNLAAEHSTALRVRAPSSGSRLLRRLALPAGGTLGAPALPSAPAGEGIVSNSSPGLSLPHSIKRDVVINHAARSKALTPTPTDCCRWC